MTEQVKPDRTKAVRIAWWVIGGLLVAWGSLGDSILSSEAGLGTARALVLALGVASLMGGALLPQRFASAGLAMLISTGGALLLAKEGLINASTGPL
jgi:hypothetical protein